MITKNYKKIILIISAVLIGSAGAGLWWYSAAGDNSPDFSKKTVEQLEQYIDSNDFRNLDPNTRRKQTWAAMGEMMGKTAEAYCSLPLDQRTQYLDQVIDKMQARRQQFEQRLAEFRPRRESADSNNAVSGDSGGTNQDRRRNADGSRQGGRRTPSLERMRERSESVSPQRRASMSVFMDAMRQRMQERGITGPGRR